MLAVVLTAFLWEREIAAPGIMAACDKSVSHAARGFTGYQDIHVLLAKLPHNDVDGIEDVDSQHIEAFINDAYRGMGMQHVN